jgi:shikimate kinase
MTRIILAGFVGPKKALIGLSIARRLGWSFVEVDRAIEAMAGVEVSEIFSLYGAERFRSLEQDVWRILAHVKQFVVSAGEPAVLAPENLGLLRLDDVVIWLNNSTFLNTHERACQFLGKTSVPQESPRMGREPSESTDLIKAGVGFKIDSAGLPIATVVDRILEVLWNGQQGSNVNAGRVGA